ncbi:MAG: DUF6864 domain-containing function [Flavobacterium sp.]
MKSQISYEEELELIDSGSFINFGQKTVTITIYEDDGTRLSVKTEFVFDKTAGDEAFKFSQFDNFTLLLTVRHKGHLANYGYINPIKIGSFNGHELFFNIRIDINSNEDSASMSYSWFKGKKIS